MSEPYHISVMAKATRIYEFIGSPGVNPNPANGMKGACTERGSSWRSPAGSYLFKTLSFHSS